MVMEQMMPLESEPAVDTALDDGTPEPERQGMRLLCLCPTYGRPSLLRNTLSLFMSQELRPQDTAHMLIYADDGLIGSQRGKWHDQHTWEVWGTNEWVRLQDKYNLMLDRVGWDAFDAAVVWDDDDVYLSNHLACHAETLESYQWSHPSRAWSTYNAPNGPAERLLNGNRYHGALAIRMDLLRNLDGWPRDYEESSYDKAQLTRCRRAAGAPGDPCQFGKPSYVYRWGDTGRDHISARIVTGRDGLRRYPMPRKQEPPMSGPLTPQRDKKTVEILGWLA
jgi:hypothetical protein